MQLTCPHAGQGKLPQSLRVQDPGRRYIPMKSCPLTLQSTCRSSALPELESALDSRTNSKDSSKDKSENISTSNLESKNLLRQVLAGLYYRIMVPFAFRCVLVHLSFANCPLHFSSLAAIGSWWHWQHILWSWCSLPVLELLV